MHVISRKRLIEFLETYDDARASLTHWYTQMRKHNIESFTDLKYLFPSVDRVENKTVFNISGNKYRLIAAIHYNRRKVYIRAILTHVQYDRGQWKKERSHDLNAN